MASLKYISQHINIEIATVFLKQGTNMYTNSYSLNLTVGTDIIIMLAQNNSRCINTPHLRLTKQYGLFSEQVKFCKLRIFRAPKYFRVCQIPGDFQ